MNGFDLSTVSGIYKGGSEISALYLGDTLIYPTNYEEEYFTISSLSTANTVVFTVNYDANYSKENETYSIYVSKDKITWQNYQITVPNRDSSGQIAIDLATLGRGHKLYLKSNTTSYYRTDNSKKCYANIKCYGSFKIQGNIMSLIASDNFLSASTISTNAFRLLFAESYNLIDAEHLYMPVTTLAYHCYDEMFYYCYRLVTAPQLPATTLAQYCYNQMFSGCASLINPPTTLPATTLDWNCYESMFRGCTSLRTTPTLPATTLANNCYMYMFSGCTSLRNAPALPATTLANNCYMFMFTGCTSLRNAPVLPATTLAYRCYSCMFQGCTSLTTAPELPATTLAQECYYYMFAESNILSLPKLPATTLVTRCYDHMFYNCKNLPIYAEDYDNISATTLADFCCNYMFAGCTRLRITPKLPATTLAYNCYSYMFKDCTYLTTVQELPATTLAQECYYWMFQGCTSLTTVPTLPATTLAQECYNSMFRGCTSLRTSPTLPATTLADYCYQSMFRGCTSLNSITMLATDITATGSFGGWVRDVAATGTFYKSPSMSSLPTGENGIPTGWVVIDAPYHISINQSQHGSVTSNKQTAQPNETVTLTISPDTEYELDTLTVLDEYSNPITVTNNQFTMPAANVTVSATFAQITYTVTINPVQNGTVTSDKQTASPGETITLTVSPNSGYELDTLTVLDANSNPITVTNNQFTMPSSNVTVSAIFDAIDYTTKYLTIVSQSNNNIITWQSTNSQYSQDIQWSTDKTNWTTVTSTAAGATLTTLNIDDTIYLKGLLTGNNNTLKYSSIKSTGTFELSGNIMSLTNGDNFINVTTLTYNYQFNHLFSGSKVLRASFLKLPATTLTTGCYYGMFEGCTALRNAPALPATTLTKECYAYMFSGCTSLNYVPMLNATTLAVSCYEGMFYGCTSISSGAILPATTLYNWCYGNMFGGCTSIHSVSISATTLAKHSCDSMFYGCTSLTYVTNFSPTTLYSDCCSHMFHGCTSLTTAPTLPATTLANACYDGMFYGCTSLTTSPTLPATTLDQNCYREMFYGCTSLTTAPTLLATTLTKGCYYSMFSGCTSLNSITMLATDISASGCLSNWVSNVAATGTFTKYDHVTLTTGDSGIPTGWTVINQYGSQYLTIETEVSGNWIRWNSINSQYSQDIQWSTDKTNWTTITSGVGGALLTMLYNVGDKIYLKGSLVGHNSANFYEYFTSSGNFKVYGNIMSLTDGDNFASATSLTQNYQLASLFRSSKVTDITNLIMPATTLKRYCYQNMFNGCKQLTTAATKLPATSVDYYSYSSMFQGCTSLVTPPVLCGITLGGYAYSTMFAGCTSLTSLPRLADATTITSWAPYRYMFSGCTGITDARYDVNGDRLLPTHITVSSGGSAFELMFQNCTNLQYAPELTDMTAHHGEYNQMFKGCTSLYSIITHASSLGTANFGAIVENTGHVGTVYKAKDVTWDTSQYSQFNYTSGSAWNVVDGNYNAGDYQT